MADIKKIKIGNDELDVTKKQDKIDSTHKLSADLVNDSSSTHKFTTAADISKLSGIEAGAEVNVQSDWSQTTTTADDYIKNKPTIGNATLTIQKNSKTIDTFTANATSNKTINIPIPTTAADVSALPSSTKYGASISVSVNSTDYKITTTLKDQDGNTLGTAQVVDLPLESVVVSGSFDSTNKKIILTLQNGNTVDIPVGDLVAGLQTEITSENKLDSDLVDDTDQAHKFMTAAERTKLSGIAKGAEVNVQSDWNVTNNTSDAFIKNKPTIPTVNNATLTIQKNGTTVKTFTANASSNVTANITVPTATSELTNDSGFIDEIPVASAGTLGGVKVGSNLSIDASGVLSADAESITVDSALSTSSPNPVQNSVITAALNNKADSADLAAVATSGSYNDLSDKPTIPTVNNGTLTIQKNGKNVQTFTANQSSNATANITVDYVKTADNLTPTADTATAWKTALNSKNGAYLTWYSVAGKFTNQPAQYGFLETFLQGRDIYQRWHTQTSGPILYRSGNGSGWSNPSTGAWNTVATTADIGNATLTIQKNGVNVQTFTANATSNKTANIQVPNLQTSDTDPGEGSALAADTFLGIYDIAPEDVDGARLVDATVTAAKLAGKAKIALQANASGSFAATDKGVLIVDEQFQNYSSNADTTARISFSGASGTTVTPIASQRSGINYTRAHVFGLALVDAGDSVSWTTTYSNAGIISNGGFSLFIPCNW